MAPQSIVAADLSKRYAAPEIAGGWIDAIRDVTFEIEEGDAVGLIGRNGAGKSTLLRILSRVTSPTSGHVDVYGRVGALLEVGTGFHPDLTGRENTYLSGAMLGLSRREVRDRFDAIVDFAEMEPFIDMPVKRLSSGMFARLGFAVAAHLRPEILIVDEVLAVGDLPFQAKCLSLMHRLTETGTTVLFVSHNLLAVSDLCSRGLVIEGGAVRYDGPVGEAITDYRDLLSSLQPAETRPTDGLLRVIVNGRPGDGRVVIEPGSRLRLDLPLDRARGTGDLEVFLNVVVETADRRVLLHLRSDASGTRLVLRPGSNVLSAEIDSLPIAPGRYSLWLRVVGLDPEEPVMWDSERTSVEVSGDYANDALVLASHRFEHSMVHNSAWDLARPGYP